MDAETGFLIEGTKYEVPSLDSLTMRERRVMYDLSGITQEDFVREEDEDEDEHEARVGKMTRHPGFTEALMHIAYQRGNPDVRADKVTLVIDNTAFLTAVEGLAVPEPEADGIPLASTTEPDRQSSSGSVENASSTPPANGSSGSTSKNGSDDEPADTQSAITSGRSDTSSALDLATWTP